MQEAPGFNWIDGAVLIAYFVSMLGLGVYQARKIKNTGDFFAGGRGFNRFLMTMHCLGTGTHADDPVGVTGASYQHGIAGIWYTFVYLFVTPFYWIMAPFFRRGRFLTTADFFEARFGSGLATLYAVWGVLIFSINMGTLLIGTGKIVDAVSLGAVNSTWAIAGMTVAFLIYGTAGGLVATVITESIQGVLIVVMSLLLVPFGLMRIGGLSGLSASVNPQMFSVTGLQELSVWWILAGFIMNLINIVAQPQAMEVFSTGKTEFEGRVGYTYGAFIKRLCALGWMFTGLIVIALASQGAIEPIVREEAFGTAIRVLLPAGFVGLMFAAILAAQMSSLSAFMVAASALLSRNIYQKHVHRAATDAEVLRFARYAGWVTVLVGVVFAFSVKGVADALMWFWTVSTFTGLFMWAGVLWRRTNATGAWASFTVMVLIWLAVGQPGGLIRHLFPEVSWLGVFADKSKLQYLFISYLPAGLLALVVGSLLGPKQPKERVARFYTLITTPVGREGELIEQGIDVVYAGESTGHPWELNHPVAVNVVGFLIALAVSGCFFGCLYLIAGLGR